MGCNLPNTNTVDKIDPISRRMEISNVVFEKVAVSPCFFEEVSVFLFLLHPLI